VLLSDSSKLRFSYHPFWPKEIKARMIEIIKNERERSINNVSNEILQEIIYKKS
jgi:hypothetical protein